MQKLITVKTTTATNEIIELSATDLCFRPSELIS